MTTRRIPIPILALALLALASPAGAQTGPCPSTNPGFVANPARGCFRAVVAEHNLAPDPVTGALKVSRYDVLVFDEAVDPATGAPISTNNISKPAIADAPTGSVWYTLPAYPLGRRVKNVVVAVGTGGSSPRGAANTSNPFGQSAPQTAPTAPSGHLVTPE